MVDLVGDVLGGELSSHAQPPFHATRNKPKAIQYLQLPYFKLLCVGCVLLLCGYHVILHATWGSDSCHWLFNYGSFKDVTVWQPWGCMIHVHTSPDARMCMRYKQLWKRQNYFAFVGDSRLRQLHRHFSNMLETSPVKIDWTAEVQQQNVTHALMHHNLVYNDKSHALQVKFLWTPHPDDTLVQRLHAWLTLVNARTLTAHINDAGSGAVLRGKISAVNDSADEFIPCMIILSMGTWSIKEGNASLEALAEYEQNLTIVIPLLLQLSSYTTVIWIFQPPVYAVRLHVARRMITNNQIDLYNDMAYQVLNKYDPKAQIRRCWSLSTIHKRIMRKESVDGLHLGETTLGYATQMLLNYYCNGDMNYSEATCCTSAEKIYAVQVVTFTVFGVFAAASLIIAVKKNMFFARCRTTKSRLRILSAPQTGRVLASRNYISVSTHDTMEGPNCTDDAVSVNNNEHFKPEVAPVMPNVNVRRQHSPSHRGPKNIHVEEEHVGMLSIDNNNNNWYKNPSGGYNEILRHKHKNSDVGAAAQGNVVLELKPLNVETAAVENGSCRAETANATPQSSLLPAPLTSVSTSSLLSRSRRPHTLADFCFTTTRIGLIMLYFFICDRTNFFMKENKYFSYLQFTIPLVYVFILGLFFTQDSNHVAVLHRDITDEWKGWMQVVILIYHFTGASRVIPIYMCIRVLVSSYLFLSGYGHFTHFWIYGDYSLYRFVSVLFRLNFLVFLLCLVMHRYYQFYYFVPLVSFWFVVLYFVMAMPPQVSAASADTNPIHYLYLMLKLVAMAGAISVLNMSEVFFTTIFGSKPWRGLFVLSSVKSYNTDVSVEEFGGERYSVNEWFFRWHLDRFSMLGGVIFAICYHLAKKAKLHSTVGSVFDGSKHVVLTCIVCFGTLLGMGVYAAFALMCVNKTQCNEVHTYFTFVPIVSYIVFRNAWGPWRVRFSNMFAWLGRVSLELFVCQYHIWLAADTHGVFVLIPDSPVLNVTVTGFIFVLVSHEMHEMTKAMHRFLVPHEAVPLYRNVLIFSVVMIAIGLSDNMIF